MWFRLDRLRRGRNGWTYTTFPLFHGEQPSEQGEEKTSYSITYVAGSNWTVGYNGVSRREGETGQYENTLTLPKIRVSSSTRCEVNITMK